MKKIFIIFLPAIFFFINDNIVAQTLTETKQVALITAITTSGKDIIINADFVQMLTGKLAVAAARKANEAEYDINAKGDTTWYVPNDYFILTESTQLRKLPVANNAQVYLVKEGTPNISKSNIAGLKRSFKGKLFKLSIFKSSVIKIAEIYTP